MIRQKKNQKSHHWFKITKWGAMLFGIALVSGAGMATVACGSAKTTTTTPQNATTTTKMTNLQAYLQQFKFIPNQNNPGTGTFSVPLSANGVPKIVHRLALATPTTFPTTWKLASGTVEQITTIPAWLFWDASLNGLTIGSNITQIGQGAFWGATFDAAGVNQQGMATPIPALTFTGHQIQIDSDAFQCANFFGTVNFHSLIEATLGNWVFNGAQFEGLILWPNQFNTLGGTPDSIAPGTFSEAQFAKNQTKFWPASTKMLGTASYTNCVFPLNLNLTNLQTIAPNALRGAHCPQGITLSAKTTIEKEALSNIVIGGTGITMVPTSSTTITATFESLMKQGCFQGTTFLPDTNLVFPSGVTQIPAFAFAGTRFMSAFQIPSSIETVGQGAFSGAFFNHSFSFEGLSSPLVNSILNNGALVGATFVQPLVLPPNLTTIGLATPTNPWGAGPFENCIFLGGIQGLTTGTNNQQMWARLTTIGTRAFAGAVFCQNFVLPKTVTTLDAGAFAHVEFVDQKLHPTTLSLQLPPGIVNIGQEALAGDSFFQPVKLIGNTLAIGPSAFQGAHFQDGLSLNYSTIQVGNKAFEKATAPFKVVINAGNELTVGKKAFQGANFLQDVKFSAKAATFEGSQAFQGASFGSFQPNSGVAQAMQKDGVIPPTLKPTVF